MVKTKFKHTDIGLIPEDWEVDEIINLAIIKTGARNTQDKTENGQYPFFIRSQKIERINSFCFEGEAVLTAGDGVGVGKVFHYINGKFDFHQRVYAITNFKENISAFYFFKYFQNNFLNRITQMTAKSSVDSVRLDTIAEMKIPLPPLAEQQAIAEVLSDTDRWIESLENLIVKKQLIKQGAMQKLLTPKEDWEVKKLGEIVKLAKSGGTPLSSNKAYYDGNIPFLSISDMTKQGKYLNWTSNYISQLGLENSASWIVPENSIIYSMYASVGFVTINKIKLATSQAVLNLILKDKYHIEFIYYILVSMQPRILKFVGEGTQKNLSAQSVKDFDLLIPSIEEQTQIATILSDMDAEIEILEQKLAKAQQIKQGLMQELLTGRKRLCGGLENLNHQADA